MRVSIIGTGYVGLTTGACLAYLGHQVTCIDTDANKIKSLQEGRVPFHEPFLAELIADAQGNLDFTTDYGKGVPQARVVFIAVGTPSSATGAPDLKYLQASA